MLLSAMQMGNLALRKSQKNKVPVDRAFSLRETLAFSFRETLAFSLRETLKRTTPLSQRKRTTSLSPRSLKVERSRNRATWYAIKPQIPNPCLS